MIKNEIKKINSKNDSVSFYDKTAQNTFSKIIVFMLFENQKKMER